MRYNEEVHRRAGALRRWPASRKRQDYFIRLAFGASRVARLFEQDFNIDPELLRPALMALVSEVKGEA